MSVEVGPVIGASAHSALPRPQDRQRLRSARLRFAARWDPLSRRV
ncbi:hypothetical protein [Streptomyces sp. WI03-4A]|nr:hypothetical protein [Streptomyces sp. WI03-4A]